jgi:DNA-directed RNA polymerase specialized sigma subunit
MSAVATNKMTIVNRLPKARTRTIARLIRKLRSERGQEPTDAELADLLACPVEKIVHHRNIIRELDEQND